MRRAGGWVAGGRGDGVCVCMCVCACVCVCVRMCVCACMCVFVRLFLVRSGCDCDNSQNNRVSGSPFFFFFQEEVCGSTAGRRTLINNYTQGKGEP